MAGYSGTPLPKKLGIKPGHRVLLARAPEGFEATLGPLEDVTLTRSARGKAPFDVIVAFFTRVKDFERDLPTLKTRLDEAGGLWIAWPKKASGVVSDLTEDAVRRMALGIRLVDNKVCAIDETWSGLRVVVRIADRGRR